jgi:quinoprotein dehydrogenase-associated probable ABC transporter substrate-binding protein
LAGTTVGRCKAQGLRLAAGLTVALLATAGPLHAQEVPETVTSDVLRVCADPANMPFSNRRAEGFENRIAEVLAAELRLPLRYYWSPQGPGFVRNTLQADLCDVVMGYASGADPVQHTNPYYRSAYVLMVRAGSDLDGVDTLVDPRLAHKKIGVTAATPPVDYLNARGLMAEARTYALLVDRRFESPGDAMVADLAAGTIDAAVLWGPIGGYYAKRAKVPLSVVPLVKEQSGPPLSYRITLGLRPGEQAWKHRLNEVLRRRRDDIARILAEFGVPVLDEEGRLATPASADPGPAQ